MRYVFPLLLIVVLAAAIVFLAGSQTPSTSYVSTTTTVNDVPDTSASQFASGTSFATTSTQASSTSASKSHATTTPNKPVSKPKSPAVQNPPPQAQVTRTELPYSTPPVPFESIDADARAALVNILCMPQGGTLRPISGSGVIIDPRGVILTNAHVAQYVLLSENPQVNLNCIIKTGSPASPHWKAVVLYIPPIWINAHYTDINAENVTGTGEHDYALLLITGDLQGNSLPAPLPFIPIDTRESIAFEGDAVLGAGYPAEFEGGIIAEQGLYAVTSESTIKQLLTFETTTVDVFSIGGVIEAQGGSSGGPVVNAWRYVVGIITTTSEGTTTAERDLHALSLNYIDRDISLQTGQSLESILAGNLTEDEVIFSKQIAPTLIQKYLDYLSK